MTDKDLLKLYQAFFVLGDNTNLKILFHLERNGEKTFTQLKEELNINPSTLSKKLKILTKFELVNPDKSHDHLRVFYTLHKHQRTLKRVLDSVERIALDF